MASTRYIAIDLGAESGRVMLGTLSPGSGSIPQLHLKELHRFPNVPLSTAGGLHWDIPQLWSQIRHGIGKAIRAADGHVHGISTDSWGVDYVLLDRNGQMLAPPFVYRDTRHGPHYDRLLSEVGAETIFAQTGIQFMSINTLYQLCAEPAALLEAADAMLLIGDYFNHLLAGSPEQPRAEITLASTTQLLNVQTRKWAGELIDHVGLPRTIFPPLMESGTPMGPSQFLSSMQTIAGCSHDTACAVAAIPAGIENDWGYISSGTWSLVGVELEKPVITDHCRLLGFTNELGAAGTTRLLKNISGLYILQQCRQTWSNAGNPLGYAELESMAKDALPLRSLIRPEAAQFGIPGDMTARIAEFCRLTGQAVPQDFGQFARCIYESLALLYRKTLLEVQQLIGRKLNRIHIVGGGSRSALLNQLTADLCGIPVITGPVEATSMGNVLIQAQALGHISATDIRPIVKASCSPLTYEPAGNSSIGQAYERFLELGVN